MKRFGLVSLAAVLLLCVVFNAPKRVWIYHMDSRLHSIEQRYASCPTLDCKRQSGVEFDAFTKDISNPPWFVIGAGQ